MLSLFNPFRKRSSKIYTIDQETKKEILKLLSGVEESQKSRYPRLALLVKMATGYVAMAVFTMAALTFSALTLYGIHNTARRIAYIDLPAISSLNTLRSSLLAQENFAEKYAILKDADFITLFRQREKETLAALTVLERSGAVEEARALKRRYYQYQKACETLFSGTSKQPEVRASAVKVLEGVDAISAQRQELLQAVISRADDLRHATIKWTIIISCCGFVFAIVVAVLICYRIFNSLKRLQTATCHLAAGDFHYQPVTAVGEELSELAANFARIAERLKALEELKGNPPEAKPPEDKPRGGGDGAAV